jgi:hypothetical protein
VNLGGDVAAGELGRAGIPAERPFLVSLQDGDYDAQEAIGASNPTPEFTSDGGGYLLLARLGDHDGKHWGIARTVAGAAPPFKSLTIVGGNTLASGQAGVKLVGTMTEVASLWDPATDGPYEDGIGNAYLFVDGASQGKVLVLNDGRAGMASSLVTSWRCMAVASISLPLTGDPTQSVLVYIPAAA